MSKIADFRNQILSIQPNGMNVFGTGIPGVGGGSMSARGGSTEADVIRSLHKDVHELLSLIMSHADAQLIANQKEHVVADLRTCNVVGLVSDSDLDKLMAILSDL